MTGLEADISDGHGFFSGTVHDISRNGLSLQDIPDKMNTRANKLSIVVNGKGRHFKLQLVPKWEVLAGNQKHIGGSLEQCSISWMDFVMHHEPEPDDVWGSANID